MQVHFYISNYNNGIYFFMSVNNLNVQDLYQNQESIDLVINKNTKKLNKFVTGAIKVMDITILPAAPQNNEMYLIASGGLDVSLTGYEQYLVIYLNGWEYIAPQTGMTIYDEVGDTFYYFDSTDWVIINSGGSPINDTLATSTSKTYSIDKIHTEITDLIDDTAADTITDKTYSAKKIHDELDLKTDKVTTTTDNAIVRFDGIVGKQQNSGVIIDDSNNVTIPGDLTVQGTTTTISTSEVLLEDKNIELGKITTPTDITADGGGITLKGTTDKTINWVDATDAWTFSENIDLTAGKRYKINNVDIKDVAETLSNKTLTTPKVDQIDEETANNGVSVDGVVCKDGNIKLSALNASEIVETDASKNLTSVAKKTAYNKDYSTTATDIKMNGAQSVGAQDTLARSDHTHPSDTTKADKTNTLELDNTTAFTPDADYEPATKKYVDDLIDDTADNTIDNKTYSAEKVHDLLKNFSNKNYIINGDFQVWQRGDSFIEFAGDQYTVDRWIGDTGASGATISITRQSFTSGQTEVEGNPSFYLNFEAVSGAQSQLGIVYRLENVNHFSSEKITLSFYIKGTYATSGLRAVIQQNFGSGGSSPVSILQTIPEYSTWQKFSKTVTLASINGKTIGSNSYIKIAIEQSNNLALANFDIAQVKLEKGALATPFVSKTYQEELRNCQYYFERIEGDNDAVSMCSNATTTNAYGILEFKTKRTQPSISISEQDDLTIESEGSTFDSTAVSFGQTSTIRPSKARMSITTSGLTAGTAGNVRFNGTGYIDIDAEI